MLLTPRFSIQQTESHIIILINVPYVKISKAEIVIEGRDFSFYCQPYLLKLTFPKDVHDEEESYTAKYNPNENNGTLNIEIKKQHEGEFFPDLDLLSTLLQRKKIDKLINSMDNQGNIEVLHSENYVDNSEDIINSSEKEQGSDNEKNCSESVSPLFLKNEFSYGFNQQYIKILKNLSDSMFDMLEIQNPETIPPRNRRQLRITRENQLFDPYRYLGDFFDSEDDSFYQQFMKYSPFWNQQWEILMNYEKELKKASAKAIEADQPKVLDKWQARIKSFEEIGGLSEKENEILITRFQYRREYLINSLSRRKSILYNLIDILFAYCYEFRLQNADFNLESCITITRMSSTLSWLDIYEGYPFQKLTTNLKLEEIRKIELLNLQYVILYSFRRLLIFPYIRFWKAGRKILTDITKILLLGKRTIVKIFIQLFDLFEKTDTHYFINKLFIEDYIQYLQQDITDEELFSFGTLFNEAKTNFESDEGKSKNAIGFYLPDIEMWGKRIRVDDEEIDSDADEDTNSGEESSSTEEDNESSKIPAAFTDYEVGISTIPELEYLKGKPSEPLLEKNTSHLLFAKVPPNITTDSNDGHNQTKKLIEEIESLTIQEK